MFIYSKNGRHMPKKWIISLIGFVLLGQTWTANASLPVGARAPLFSTSSAKAGEEFGFNLAAALAKGPVVIYFYPKAFTRGCTLEANAFADALPEFSSLGATVIGLSNDDIETLRRFSVEECRSMFAVGIASPSIIEAYKVRSSRSGFSERTSFVIDRNGTITLVYSNPDYRGHVQQALQAVRSLSRRGIN